MATILSRITEFVRNELNDEMSSRWDDSQLLTFFKQAVRRANTIGQLNRLKFMRGKAEPILLAGSTSVPLPADFLTPISLTRMDTNTPLHGYDEDKWDTIVSAGEVSVYLIDENNLEIKGASSNDVPLSLRYYVHVDPDVLTLSSQTPWGGKLDYIICEYVSLRARKVDRYDTSIDSALMDELEKDVLGMFADLSPTTLKSRGWNTVGKG